MGCATSKQPVCRNCRAPCSPSPVPRSYSMHVHHPPLGDGDTYHVVALTSTTLGTLKIDPLNHTHHLSPTESKSPIQDEENRIKDFSMGMIEAKTWSKMIDEKIPKVVPKTPIRTPPGEPETINVMELMEGLEDTTSPLRLRPPHHHRSFSFHVSAPNSKPLWLEMAENESNSNSSTSVVSDFDPDVIATFRKSLEELPPANPFRLKPLTTMDDGDNEPIFKLNAVVKDKLVLYFTSLRGVRKTYEDCCHVRVILKGLGIRVDERDVSMHSGFKDELKELLGDGFNGGGLPRVFVGKKYIGGAEEIRRMHEDGQLEKVLDGCEMVDDGGSDGGGGGGVCEGCGDVRFTPCETCSGSCKIYYEGDYDEESDESEYGFQRCPDCNENGLIRCPICCD